jgi:predicted O-linked N-acetylglucosamine transferase (SPINDLY family)
VRAPPEHELRRLREALRVQPGDARLHHALGGVLYALRRPIEALPSYEAALRLRPNYVEAYNDRGLTLIALGRLEEALASYSAALTFRPNYPEAWYNRANVHAALGRFAAAEADYRKTIEHGLRRPEVYNNLALTLEEMGRTKEAVEHLRRAIGLDPTFADGWYNLAGALERLQFHKEALAAYDRALSYRSEFPRAHAGRGQLLMQMRQPAEALASFEQAMRLEPRLPWLRGNWLDARLYLCEWADFDREVHLLANEVQAGYQATTPLTALSLLDTPSVHRRAAEIWAPAAAPRGDAPSRMQATAPGGRTRIGYFSADLRSHPVAALTAGMFEHQDRSRFEVFAFSFGPDTTDAVRVRLKSAFDHFLDVKDRSDEEIAAVARSFKIDIAVDLQGFTEHQRPGIFARRAAPIQVLFLGYPGTLGSSYIDYLIADHVVVPEASRGDYAEKIVYLPHSFQPNDRGRRIADRSFSRSDLGLPEEAFVFCCFNTVYKIQPAIFRCWMRILGLVPGSVLWLAQMGERAAANLRNEAQRCGIDPLRLMFAPKMPAIEDHLARYRAADLFLDTLPYGAHATASDALWAGLPLLTICGNAFAARVGASLLSTLGLEELITTSLPEYERLAVALANSRPRLESLRARLAVARLSAPLFDTEGYTRSMEAAYDAMVERSRSGLEPEHIDLRAPTMIGAESGAVI